MTIFSDNPHDRRIERFMTAIPNFKPRGVGVRFSESQILITVTAATPTEILVETMRQIAYAATYVVQICFVLHSALTLFPGGKE